MDKLISIICKTSEHHLRNIGNVTKFLDQGSIETLVHSFVALSVPRSRTEIGRFPSLDKALE